MSKKKLRKSKKDKVIAGVCAGLAHYLNIDPVILRIIWILLVICFGVGIIAYLVMWIIMPNS